MESGQKMRDYLNIGRASRQGYDVMDGGSSPGGVGPGSSASVQWLDLGA